jgi:hypothetical protein
VSEQAHSESGVGAGGEACWRAGGADEGLPVKASAAPEVAGGAGGFPGDGALDAARGAAAGAVEAASGALDAAKDAFSSTAASSLDAISGTPSPCFSRSLGLLSAL